ncbi:MAG: protein kinase [Thermogutta sp.]|nr:protein kinase [Thermogutta sp.]
MRPAGDEPTLDMAPRDSTAAGGDSASQGAVKVAEPKCPAVRLVSGSPEDWTCALHAVLHRRLRLAVWIMAAAFAIFLLWQLPLFQPDVAWERYNLAFHVLCTSFLIGAGAWLTWGKCQGNYRAIRSLELAAFAVPALFLAYGSWFAMAHSCQERGFFEFNSGSWMLLIFAYALFIPNTVRRAALVIGILAAVPILILVAGRLFHPDIAQAMRMEHMTVIPLMFIVSGIMAVLGVDSIQSLRRESFEAHQFGQYRLRERLGGGGMGEVYLAEHVLLKRPCVVKLIRPERMGDPRTLARFEREVRTTARLSHWNTVEIFDYGLTGDGVFYYVMEYLPGLDLGALVREFGPLPPERVIFLLSQACDSIREAHELGFIHRDLKPSNIFVAQRGGVFDVVKVLDFGLVKPIAEMKDLSLTAEGSVTGSPLYMSPEQAMGNTDLDPRSDIYSLGAVAYFTLTGRPPFEADKPIRVILAHIQAEVVSPRDLRPDLPEDLTRIVLRCLEKNPGDRFQTANDLREALARCEAAGRWTRERAAAWWKERQLDRPRQSPTSYPPEQPVSTVGAAAK